MKHNITLEIECSETTCASEPGKFCYLFASDLGGDGICYLYGKVFQNDSSQIEQHPRCLEATVKQPEPEPTTTHKTKTK